MAEPEKTPIEAQFSPRDTLYFKVCDVVQDDLVLSALKKIDRADFTPDSSKDRAYEDSAFDIGPDSSISKVSLVGEMIEYLELKGGEKVLELGAGSGFEAGWLKLIVGDNGCVYSTEINEGLCNEAKTNLGKAGISGVNIINTDGARGLPEQAPFDAIIVSATFRVIPEELLAQLKEGGKIVAPVGKDPNIQDLVVGTKVNGKMEYKVIDPAVWFHKVFSEVEGCWNKDLLAKSKELKFQFAFLYVKFMTDSQREEMWQDIGKHLPEFAGKPLDEKVLVQVFINNRKGSDSFYEILETSPDDNPHPDVTPHSDSTQDDDVLE